MTAFSLGAKGGGKFALKASGAFAIAGFAGIFFYDRIFARLVDHDTFVVLESYKGFAFIAVTAALLYIVLQRSPAASDAGGSEDAAGSTQLIVSGAVTLTLAIACVAGFVFQNSVASMEQAALNEVRAIVQLKGDDLGRWLQAQQAGATAFASQLSASDAVDRLDLRGIDGGKLHKDLSRQAAEHNFADVDLVFPSGGSFFSPNDEIVPEVATAAAKVFTGAESAFVDLHFAAGKLGPRFGYLVPMHNDAEIGASPLALYVELAAHDHLYPFVRYWPLAHATGSGVLARRDGGDVLFLSDFPGRANAALHFRLPFMTSGVPIVRFLRGEPDAGRGIDPTGTMIFAAGAKVHGTDWEMVAQINENEALAEKNGYERTVVLVTAIAVAAIWVIAGFLLQSQKLARARSNRRIQYRFQLMFEQAASGMAHADLDGNLLRVNQRVCEIFGFTREELLSSNILSMCEPDDLGALRTDLEAIRSGVARDYYAERRYRRKAGGIFDAAISGRLARGEDGDPDYLMMVIEDISERKAVQLALQQSEERFRLALEGAREGVWDWRPETDEAYFSPGWKAMLGYEDHEIENQASAWRRVVDPEGRGTFRKQFGEIRAGQRKTFEFETRMRHKHGHWLDILSRGLPVFNEAGRMSRVVGADLDITQRKAHEADMRLAATVFTSTHEGVVVTDCARNILMVNPAFVEITGYSDAEMLGKNMRMMQSGRHDRSFFENLWKTIETSGFWRGEIWNRRKRGEIYPEWLTISAVRDATGAIVNYVGVFSDISRLKQSEERLRFLAYHDPLTGLPNRTLLSLRIEHAIQRCGREQSKGAVLFLDLDRFKTVNDSLGHAAGDDLLVQAAERWKAVLRPNDTLARAGGDEFVVLLEDLQEPCDAAVIGQKVIEATLTPFALAAEREACVGLSIGVSLFPTNAVEPDALIQQADSALYLAKAAGGSTLRFYSDAMTAEASARLEIEAGLRRGLDRGEFVLQFQPLVSLIDGNMVGAEALVRWRSPSGLVPPDQFIPLAERTGLIIPLGEWVLREACSRAQAWRDQGAKLHYIAVNLSPVQLSRANMAERVKAILDETGLPPECLEIEITENAFAGQGGDIEARLRALKALGVRLAIDDFGAGHSSLFYLKRFPIDKLKLDRDFIRDIPSDPISMEIAVAILRLANALGITALAEGVETRAQADFLAASGCQLAQGYLFDRPLWESDFLDRLRATGRERAAG